MKHLKSLLVAVLSVVGAPASMAADHTFNGVMSTYLGEALSGVSPAYNWTFTDSFTFEIASGFNGLAGDALGGVITLRGWQSDTTITGLSVSGFGPLADADSNPSNGFQFTLGPLAALTDYSVTVSGSVASLNLPTSAAYYDVQAIAVVPEPAGYALALASMAVLGVAGSRRSRNG